MSPGTSPARVALLTNFIAPYRLPLFRLLAQQLGALRVFVSTPMEPNRSWEPDSADLDVSLLPTWTLRRSARHPHAFSEPLFVHLPYGAPHQLRRFRPDVIVSGQLGLASLLAALHCRLHRQCALVLWLTLSEVSELGRGAVRRGLRRWLLRRADAVMVNGESGARYVQSFGVPEERIFRVYQTVDVARFANRTRRDEAAAHRLLFVGSGEPRKGLGPFLVRLGAWARAHPERQIALTIVGTAAQPPAQAQGLPANLRLSWLGTLPYERLPDVYADGGILVFPTLADEWGLVVNEAMAAGLPVLGSLYSQAVLELVEEGATGWTFHPDRPEECDAALDRALDTPPEALDLMRERCRQRIGSLSLERVAGLMLEAIDSARGRRAG